MRLDLGRPFVYGFEDPDWPVKMLIGALIYLVGLVFSVILVGLLPLMVLSGYMMEIARNVSKGQELPLPTWDAFGEYLADGFRLWVALFVWAIPIILLTIPTALGWVFVGNSDSGALTAIGALSMLSCGLLLTVYTLFFLVITPIVTWLVASEGSVGAGLNVRRVLGFLKKHPGEVLIVALMSVVANTVASTLGSILCVVGLFPAYIWYLWVSGHYVGQLGRLEKEEVREALVTPAETE
ncbi:MAG: DUF4013 domain-containing protein [Chloroflexi bacterium]|nr:DUF4013 domain-containing protein [Chloroflexota bacterium]